MKQYLILAFAFLLQIVALGQNAEAIIPNGATYSASGGTLIFWSELR